MKIQQFLVAAFFGSMMLIASCAKDGAVGPAGATGTAGPAGPTGATGATGATGTANVQGGTVTTSTWTVSGVQYYTDLTFSAITQAVVDRGDVHVYMGNGAGGYWPLAYTYYPSSTYSSTFQAVHFVGGVRVWAYDSDLTLPAHPGTRLFKVVAIPPGMRDKINVNWNNYAEVAKTFHLTE